MSRIRVTIDRIALRGLDAAQRKALLEGLQVELSQLLGSPASRASLMKSRRTPVLKLGHVPLGPGSSGGRKVGAGIARAIGRSVNP